MKRSVKTKLKIMNISIPSGEVQANLLISITFFFYCWGIAKIISALKDKK